MLLLPFESLPEIKFVNIDGLHLVQYLGTSPDEEPYDYQAQIRSQVRSMLIMEQAATRLAEKQGMPLEEAKKTIFNVNMPQDANDRAAALYQYFTTEEVGQLLEAQAANSNRLEQATKAATYFLRNRVAYPVKLRAIVEASTRPTELPIAPLAYPIADKQKLKFSDDCTVQIVGFHAVGSRTLKVQSIPMPIDAEKVGYLLDIETGDYRLGNPDWQEEHTKRRLKIETIGKIYQFYLSEKAGIAEWEAFTLLTAETETEEEEAGKFDSESCEDFPGPSRSTGAESFGSSNTTDAEMSDSATKTLVGSQAG